MREYLLENMKKGNNGLYLCELPTGYGKTYQVVRAMKEYVDNVKDGRKIIYLTTLNKNLPEDELRSLYQNEEEYKKNVLRLYSNLDQIVNHIHQVTIPEEMQSRAYQMLCADVSNYKVLLEKGNWDKDYKGYLEEKIMKNERIFRYEIRKKLKKSFKSKESRKKAIKNDKKFQWIGQLYPAVFTDDYRLILMSVNKFMKKNSVLIEDSYDFLKESFIKNSVVIIDEFDATKSVIRDEIINKSLAIQENYISLFRQICNNLDFENFSREMQISLEQIKNKKERYCFEGILARANEIRKKYYTQLNMKIKEELIDQKQVFLFNDGSFHTILDGGKSCIRSVLNKEENRIDIYLEDKEEFYTNRNKNKEKDNEIVLYSMLREIRNFFRDFSIFYKQWAFQYQKFINSRRLGIQDEMTLESAVSSIFERLQLSEEQKELLMLEICHIENKKKLAEYQDFYEDGMEYYGLEDHDSHYDSTNLRFVKIFDTPEKIIHYLSKKTMVFGISATAEMDTVLGNYNLSYLQNKLKEQYHKTPEYLKEKIRQELGKKWNAYENGKVKINTYTIQNESQFFQIEEYCRTFLSREKARICHNLIGQKGVNSYIQERYCHIIKAMDFFCRTKDIHSMLYLGMALPKRNYPEMDEELLNKLFEIVQHSRKTRFKLCVLRGEDYDKDKSILQQELAQGKKIFVMSSYQTLGAGQNLQYKIPIHLETVSLGEKQEGDQRYLYKDFDAICLGNITNVIVNIYGDNQIDENALIQLLFQTEELYENGEINYEEKDYMVKKAFQAFVGKKNKDTSKLHSTRSMKVQVTKMVMQAVGRLCRTFIKNPNIYILAEVELLKNIYVGNLKSKILPPEMESIITMCKNIGVDYGEEEICILNKAEKISLNGHGYIRRILSQNWTEKSIRLWEKLREIVLKYPTASKEIWEQLEEVKLLYITSGKKQNQYLYFQYSDYNNVVLDFNNNEIEFKHSKRAKLKGELNEVIVCEMSEKESGLQSILKYRGMVEWFKQKEYALSFPKNDYMMSPILFHNIYKGALGEEAGKFILEQELGIKLEPITDPEQFEFFDFKVGDDIYIDFKNWKETYLEDKDTLRQKILWKMEQIGAKKVYIINIVSEENYQVQKMKNNKIVEIPRLIDENGKVDYENLKVLQKDSGMYR